MLILGGTEIQFFSIQPWDQEIRSVEQFLEIVRVEERVVIVNTALYETTLPKRQL